MTSFQLNFSISTTLMQITEIFQLFKGLQSVYHRKQLFRTRTMALFKTSFRIIAVFVNVRRFLEALIVDSRPYCWSRALFTGPEALLLVIRSRFWFRGFMTASEVVWIVWRRCSWSGGSFIDQNVVWLVLRPCKTSLEASYSSRRL